MTKKDYELIAEVLNSQLHGAKRSQNSWEVQRTMQIIDNFAEVLGSHNVRFDANKFKKACGYFQA